MAQNLLYYGDNLDILRRYLKGEAVGLVYLDSSFKSNRDCNVLLPNQDGSRSAVDWLSGSDTAGRLKGSGTSLTKRESSVSSSPFLNATVRGG